MKESSTYQAILHEGEAIGEAKEARKVVLILGRERFGEPSATILALLDTVTDLDRLEELVLRLLHAKSWEELLGVNGKPRQSRGRKKV